ncbi:ImmA/IrrE family metallo-endopeptidase [Paractinoplanes atraurantiacus]|uniref:IrrE N-terminal-like domain-containing protein n=1 Tax=Paractinoplanes atraurantiacus TaxID=1036182 RepID=A0A285JAF6_9ACTN|nr:ImmA/IrrE family metallo-endopeptidase [Actinoplanes atraurantiacus]SNY57245.1 protein of unknown function [Actinoplanes atraurantiacus]
MNWQTANATAMLRAPQVHRDLGIDRSGYVDVFAALRAAGIECMAQNLSKLFGFYVGPDDDGPAVLLNASLDEVNLRHTAAHELGHHVFGHGSRADTELDIAGLQPQRQWTAVEKQAESFAAWFLMPLPAVDAALQRIGTDQVRQPEQAYELARWLGTSYAGTVRHLRRLKKISARVATSWPQVAPQRLRARIHRATLQRPKSHLFLLRPSARNGLLHVAVGDLLLLPPGARAADVPEGLVAVESVEWPSDSTSAGPTDPDDTACAALEVTEQFRRSCEIVIVLADADSYPVSVMAPVRRRGADVAWGTGADVETPTSADRD